MNILSIVNDRDKFNNLKPIRMMEMQCETVYQNIYKSVSDYMKIHHDCF